METYKYPSVLFPIFVPAQHHLCYCCNLSNGDESEYSIQERSNRCHLCMTNEVQIEIANSCKMNNVVHLKNEVIFISHDLFLKILLLKVFHFEAIIK